MRYLTLLLLAATSAGCTVQAPTTSTPRPGSRLYQRDGTMAVPFSSAVRAGDFLFVSGQIGFAVVDGAPKLVSGGIDAETKQTLENIKAILTKAGSSMDRVVKCSVMMADMAEWPQMNTIYAMYFPGNKPARSAWGANGLALGARVEIECIALAH